MEEIVFLRLIDFSKIRSYLLQRMKNEKMTAFRDFYIFFLCLISISQHQSFQFSSFILTLPPTRSSSPSSSSSSSRFNPLQQRQQADRLKPSLPLREFSPLYVVTAWNDEPEVITSDPRLEAERRVYAIPINVTPRDIEQIDKSPYRRNFNYCLVHLAKDLGDRRKRGQIFYVSKYIYRKYFGRGIKKARRIYEEEWRHIKEVVMKKYHDHYQFGKDLEKQQHGCCDGC